MLIKGADFSYSNGYPDWTKIGGDSETQFAYLRACYGAQAEDYSSSGFDIFHHNHDGAKAQGIPTAPYIFTLRPTDGVTQAQYFLGAIDGYQGQNRPVLDVEEQTFIEGDWTDIPANIAWLAAISDFIAARLCVPDIYTNDDTWARYFAYTDAFSGHHFWIANAGATPGKPNVPDGIPAERVLVHQFAFDGILPGVETKVDLDCLVGDVALSALLR